MFGYLDFLFLSFHGRIGRAALWIGCIVIGLAQIGAMAFLLHLAGGSLADIRAYEHDAAALTHEGSLVSVAGGGDTVAALNQAGVADDFTFISTAGGAFLEWMEGKELPGVAALTR